MIRPACRCSSRLFDRGRAYRVGRDDGRSDAQPRDAGESSSSRSSKNLASVWDRIALSKDTAKTKASSAPTSDDKAKSRAPGKSALVERYNFSRPSAPTFESTGQASKTTDEGDILDDLIQDDFAEHPSYRRVTAVDLINRREPPTRCKMLVRDFIHDSLYNPQYGYFSKQALIYSTGEDSYQVQAPKDLKLKGKKIAPLLIDELKDNSEFLLKVGQRYLELEGEFDENDGLGKQVWHTPTELFSPHYGRAIAHYILKEYRLNLYPYEDLVIYELGAGNGTLMRDIITCIAQHGGPEILARTRYRIVEISPQLARLQRKRIEDLKSDLSRQDKSGNHLPVIEVINQSFFEWKQPVPSPVFVLALEVLDNFAHDVVRFSTDDGKAYQAVVASNGDGDFTELYEPVHDPLIERYLTLRQEAASFRPSMVEYLNPARPQHMLFPKSVFWLMSAWQAIRKTLPFAPNLSPPQFLATQQLRFLDTLHKFFPTHRLIISDFDRLPDSIDGGGNSGVDLFGLKVKSQRNSPVVQTRYRNSMVPCGTYMVQQGWFDIFFPTDFGLLRDIYSLVVLEGTPRHRRMKDFFNPKTSVKDVCREDRRSANYQSPFRRPPEIYSHREFLETYSDDESIKSTTTRSGENPMLEYYENARFFVT